MPAQIVDNNFLLADRALSVQTKFNAGSRLRLFKSAMTPEPVHTLALYTAIECNFDTYTIVVLNPNWAAPTKVVDGEYQTLSQPAVYASPSTVGNTIYGIFVDDGAGNLLFAEQFDMPISFTIGAPGLTLQIAYQVFAKSIL